MNQSELIDLSKAAAKVAGISPARALFRSISHADDGEDVWLHEDSARCFELMCRYDLDIVFMPSFISCGDADDVFLRDHNNNREQATRVAILKAIVEIGEQK